MKRTIIFVLILIGGIACNDEFLDRYPLDEISPQTYFKTENDFIAYINVSKASFSKYLMYNNCANFYYNHIIF